MRECTDERTGGCGREWMRDWVGKGLDRLRRGRGMECMSEFQIVGGAS